MILSFLKNQKDKAKARLRRKRANIDTLPYRYPRPFICPRCSCGSRSDKHSDLTFTANTVKRVTVMAVAADFHRDFLICSVFILLLAVLYHTL